MVEIVDTGRGSAKELTSHGSVGAALARLAVGVEEIHLNVVHLDAGGRIGRHPAGVPQLLLVMTGSGTVSGADAARIPITAGQAAVWESGEAHDTHADTAMTALVVEAAELHVGDQTLRMPDPG